MAGVPYPLLWQKYVLMAGVAICGAALGAMCLHLYQQRSCGGARFLRHEYACDAPNEAAVTKQPKLENEIRTRLGREQADGKLTRAGIYFQRLSDGVGFSINDDAMFAPASMLKLPIAFGILLVERQSPGTLQEEIPYTPEQATGFVIPEQIEVAESGLERGKSYSVEELLRATITYSDNLAYYILLARFGADHKELMTRTFRELGIQDPVSLEHDAASVREYAGLFRLLYNASYLDASASEKLLSWLAASTYDKGIAAGTPSGVAVANKFGERKLPDGTHELHDCGIVYSDAEPYVLCVMTKGHDFAALESTIADVSNTIYASVVEHAR
jgi:beta-lactamase class A